MKRLLTVCLLVGVLVSSRSTRAEDQTTVSAARELAKQGFKAYHEGRYREAAEKSLEAYQLVRVPTLAVNRARALTRLGKLVEASEWYLEASGLRPAQEAWQDVQYEAQGNAERERGELLPRIPRIRIVIEGADPAQVAVRIGDTGIPVTLDVEQPIDPGEYTVIGRRGNEEVRTTVWAKEAERLLVKLKFGAVRQHSNVQAIPARLPTRLPTRPPLEQSSKGMNTLELFGWGGVVLGGFGIVFGSIEGLAARSKRNSLLESGRCSDRGVCDPSAAGEVDSLMTRRTLSTVGFVAGGVLAAAGVTVLLWPTTPNRPPPLAMAVGPGFINIQGGLR